MISHWNFGKAHISHMMIWEWLEYQIYIQRIEYQTMSNTHCNNRMAGKTCTSHINSLKDEKMNKQMVWHIEWFPMSNHINIWLIIRCGINWNWTLFITENKMIHYYYDYYGILVYDGYSYMYMIVYDEIHISYNSG